MNNDQTTAKQARQFVILEGIALGNRFFSSHTEGDDPTKGANGQTWYKIIGYAASVKEAQQKLGFYPGSGADRVAQLK